MHIISAADGVVYDSIFSEPQPVETYFADTFAQNVEVRDTTHLFGA